MAFRGLPRPTGGYLGITLATRGLPWLAMDYRGLPWLPVAYLAGIPPPPGSLRRGGNAAATGAAGVAATLVPTPSTYVLSVGVLGHQGGRPQKTLQEFIPP